jgi:hypothetical protein
MDVRARVREIEDLQARLRRLESELAEEEAELNALSTSYYPAYYATAGALLGIFGAMSSLLVNIVGALAVGKNPLQLVRVYLTFPLGEQALLLTDHAKSVYAVSDGVILAMGCCLYVLTGMVLGIPFYLALTRLTARATIVFRLVVASALALGIWLINFYGILSWLQPLVFGGNWIVELVPWWVAAGTHLVFGWTIVILYRLGEYSPYRRLVTNHGAAPAPVAPAQA